MTRGRDIHMISFSRMFFDEHGAKEEMARLGIDGNVPIYASMSINFILAPRGLFKDMWMDRRKGYYIHRGTKQDDTKRRQMLHQPNGSLGAYKAQEQTHQVGK